MHPLWSLGPLNPLTYPHRVADDPDNKFAWIGDGSGMYMISVCFRFEFDGEERYLEIVKIGYSASDLCYRVEDVVAFYSKCRGHCTVRCVLQSEHPLDCETMYKLMASGLGLLLRVFDENDRERNELLNISPSQILLARDILISLELAHSPTWAEIADMERIVCNAPCAGKNVPPVLEIGEDGSVIVPDNWDSLGYVDQGDEDKPLDVDNFVDAFGTGHGMKAFREHMKCLGQVELKLACLRRGVAIDGFDEREHYVGALWTNCLLRVRKQKQRRKRMRDVLEDHTLQVELLHGNQDQHFQMTLAFQQVFQARMDVDNYRHQQNYNKLKSAMDIRKLRVLNMVEK